MKKCYSEKEWQTCNWKKVLTVKHNYTGPEFSWVAMTDLLWGRCFVVSKGAQLVFGMSFQTVLMRFAKQNGKNSASEVEGASIQTLGEHFTQIPMPEFQNLGGFWIFLKSGEGVVVPPMTMVGHVNAGLLEHPPASHADLANVTPGDFLEPWLCLSWYLVLFYFPPMVLKLLLNLCHIAVYLIPIVGSMKDFPVLTREQLENFDFGAMDETMKLYSGEQFSKALRKLSSARSMVKHLQQNLVKAEVPPSTCDDHDSESKQAKPVAPVPAEGDESTRVEDVAEQERIQDQFLILEGKDMLRQLQVILDLATEKTSVTWF